MKNVSENMYFVGVLQDLGMPYASLCVDKENRQLYLLVRSTNDRNADFLAANVSYNDIVSYMKEDLGLVDIFRKCPAWYATIGDDDRISLGKSLGDNFIPSERMLRMDMFNPELCDDDVWLDVFLSRINNNQPLEIA